MEEEVVQEAHTEIAASAISGLNFLDDRNRCRITKTNLLLRIYARLEQARG